MSDRAPLTDIELLIVKILLAVDDHKISDIRIALDLASSFLATLDLEPGERLVDGKKLDRDQRIEAPILH